MLDSQLLKSQVKCAEYERKRATSQITITYSEQMCLLGVQASPDQIQISLLSWKALQASLMGENCGGDF